MIKRAFNYKRKLSKSSRKVNIQSVESKMKDHETTVKENIVKRDVLELTLRGHRVAKQYCQSRDLVNMMVVDNINNDLSTYRKPRTKRRCSKAA